MWVPILILVVMYFVVKGEDNTISESGGDLEEKTAATLRTLFNGYVSKNVLLPINIGTTECDVVCATTRGVFVVECKHRKDSVTGSVHADTWAVTGRNQTFSMENPLKQNYYHCQAMMRFLENNGLPNIPVYNVVVMIGKGTVSLIGESGIQTKIYRSYSELNHLLSYPECVSPEIVERCRNIIAGQEGSDNELQAHTQRVMERYAS